MNTAGIAADRPNPMQLAAERFVECRHVGFWRYWQRRLVNEATLTAFQIGYNPPWPALAHPYEDVPGYMAVGLFQRRAFAMTGALVPRYIDCYTFPFIENGEVCGMVFRMLNPAQKQRYLNLERNDHIAWPPGRVVRPHYYGVDGSWAADEVTVVEGPVDMLRAWQAGLPNPVALCGLGVADDQVLDLLIEPRTVYLLLDWDDDGRTRAFGLAIRYMRYLYEQEVGIEDDGLNFYAGRLVIVVPDDETVAGWDDKDPGGAPDDISLLQLFHASQRSPEEFVRETIEHSIPAHLRSDETVHHTVERFILNGGMTGRQTDAPIRPRGRYRLPPMRPHPQRAGRR